MTEEKIFKNAFGKKYNIEWYLGNGEIMTTSAVLVDSKFGYLYFAHPNDELIIIERRALRSMWCIK